MDTDLRNRVILITGASGGIGSAIARHAAAEGANLVLHANKNSADAEALRESLGEQHLVVSADLRDESAVDAMFARAVEHFGCIDCLVANAGVWPREDVPISNMPLERWRNTIDIDLTGTFLTCRAFLRHLCDSASQADREHGSIVLVGSTAALFGEACHGDYAAAKAGIVYGLTRTLKNEIVRMIPHGRVNAVCPGWTATPMADADLADEAMVRRVQATMPLRKVGTADDVASSVIFLLSDKLAGHISGAILPIAGGMEGRLLNPPEHGLTDSGVHRRTR